MSCHSTLAAYSHRSHLCAIGNGRVHHMGRTRLLENGSGGEQVNLKPRTQLLHNGSGGRMHRILLVDEGWGAGRCPCTHTHTFKIRATWAGHQTSTCVDTCTTFTKTKTEQTTSHARSSRSTTGIAKGSAALVSSNANVAATGSLHNTAARHNPPSHITGYAEGDDNQW